MRKMNGKAVLRVFLVLLLVGILAPRLNSSTHLAQASAEATLYVDPAVGATNVGESYAVDVCIENVVDLFSYEAKLAFNASILLLTEVIEGPFIKDQTTSPMGTFFLHSIDVNFVHVGCTTLGKYPGVNGSGILFTLAFNGTNSGTSNLDLYDSILLNSNVTEISHNIIDGTVSVTLPGDVNGDGVVNVLDLALVSLAYGTFEGEPGYNPEADLNEDGIVDMKDLYIVARHLGAGNS